MSASDLLRELSSDGRVDAVMYLIAQLARVRGSCKKRGLADQLTYDCSHLIWSTNAAGGLPIVQVVGKSRRRSIGFSGGCGTRLRTVAEPRLRLRGSKRCVQPDSVSVFRLGTKGVGD